MSNQITDYKCPSCAGPLHFDSATGKLTCDYCGSSYTVEEVEKMVASQNAEAVAAAAEADARAAEGVQDEWTYTSQEWIEKGMKAYQCPSCGAELVMDETTAATACPYCGNTTMVPGKFSGTLKPDYIIPFKLDKKMAVTELKKYYHGKPFLPKAFTNDNHIDEIKGVYVPFWLYDGDAHAEGLYKAEKVSSHREGDYKITETFHYQVSRAGDLGFEKIPADASSKMPDDLMDSIEPYNYGELTSFSSAYLAGYMANKYDVSAEDNAKRATDRAKQSALNEMKKSVTGYHKTNPVYEKVSVKQGKVSYAMLPVWMLSTSWNNQHFLFAMNGQSGKFVGTLPTDKKKATLTFIGIALLLEILMGLFVFLGHQDLTAYKIILEFLLIPFGISGIVTGILKGKMSNVSLQSAAALYETPGGMTFTRRTDQFLNRTVTREKVSNGSSGSGKP